jgi:hypothetical protein
MTDHRTELTLEQRVSALEDKLAIYELVVAYGMAVDSGAGQEAGELFGDDGVFDSSGGLSDRARLEALAAQCGALDYGYAHVTYPPIVTVDGDRATVTCYSNSLEQQNGQDDYRALRLSANRWDLERVEGRWTVRRRTNRAMTGSEESKAILAGGAVMRRR